MIINNTGSQATVPDLQHLFAPFGVVKTAHFLSDGYGNGFHRSGFVVMDTEAEACKAITALNHSEWMKHTITVSQATFTR